MEQHGLNLAELGMNWLSDLGDQQFQMKCSHPVEGWRTSLNSHLENLLGNQLKNLKCVRMVHMVGDWIPCGHGQSVQDSGAGEHLADQKDGEGGHVLVEYCLV